MPTPDADEMWRQIQGLLGRTSALERNMTSYIGTPTVSLQTFEAYFTGLTGATSWTPTIAQGATNNIAKTITYAKYFAMGKLIVAGWDLTVTGAGTANNAITISLPVTGATSSPCGGTFRWFDNGTRDNWGHTTMASTTTVAGQETASASYGAAGAVDANALANTDVLRGLVVYEAA